MEIKEGILLKDHTSYRIGGPAKYFAVAENENEIEEALRKAEELGEPLFVLAGGNNVLFSDNGFNGFVLKISLEEIKVSENKIFAQAGASMKKIVDLASENGLSGLEWAGGLPGTLGGAIFGNAGAFQGEMKDSVLEVRSLKTDEQKLIVTRNNEECQFNYRNSIFKQERNEIILGAILVLNFGDGAEIRKETEANINYRVLKQPLDYPSCGSVFKNVNLINVPEEMRFGFSAVIKTDPFPVVPAAYLISEAGLKGMTVGGAKISEKHPNFIINFNNAKAQDILDLIQSAKNKVKEKFGINLEEEVQIIQ